MKRSKLVVGVAMGLLGTGLVACRSSPTISSVRAELEDRIDGAEFEEEFHLRLGRVRLGLARRLAGWALAEDEDIAELLKSVRRIEIGSYRVVSLPPLDEIEASPELMRRLVQAGWSLVLGSRDEGERVWMFVRSDGTEGIRNIYLVTLDEHELTMVSLEGPLDELLAEAIAEDPVGFAASMAS